MRFLARCRRDEGGVTLVELVVVVLLLAIVSTLMFNFLDNTNSLTTRATASVVKENEGRQALREMTQDIRAANKIVTTEPSGEPSCAPLVTYPGAYPSCLRFEVQRSVDSTQACPKSVITYGLVTTSGTLTLRKSRTDYAADCSTISSRVQGRIVVSNVSNTSATPLFEFFNSANQQLVPTVTTDKAAYVKAASIRINLWLKYNSKSPDLKMTSAVALRNNR